MAVYGSGNGHQLPVGGQSVNATPCTLNENAWRQQRADSPQQQWADPQQQQHAGSTAATPAADAGAMGRLREPNTWQTAGIELCLHSGASQLIECQEVCPLAYSVSDSDTGPTSTARPIGLQRKLPSNHVAS